MRDTLTKSVPFERRRVDGEAAIGPETEASGGHALGVQVTGHVLQVQTGRFGRHGVLRIGANACASETVKTRDRVVPSEETTSAGADSQSFRFDEILFATAKLFARGKPKGSPGSLWARSARRNDAGGFTFAKVRRSPRPTPGAGRGLIAS